MSLSELMRLTIAEGASDLHLSAGERPRLRIDGTLTELDRPPLTEDDMLALVAEALPPSLAGTWAEEPMANALLNVKGPGGARFRTAAYKHCGGTALAMRLWPQVIPSPAQIGVPEGLLRWVEAARHGLVLVSGPTGSGKSTTVYSLVDHLNAHRAAHIVWIGEPAEYLLTPRRSVVRHIEVGTHMPTLAHAARAALRADPDIVVLAEMRDLESVALAMALAEAGHLVFTTIHCATAPEAAARIVEVFPGDRQPSVARQLAACLGCVTAQRLLPRASGRGRAGAYEVLVGTPAVRALIAERRFGELAAAIGAGAEGMQTLQQHADRLVREGTVAEGGACLGP